MIPRNWDRRSIISFLLLLGATIIFIVYKFIFVVALWNGRNIPPSPDDTYLYLSFVEQFASYGFNQDIPAYYYQPNDVKITYFPWVAGITLIKQIFGFTVEKAFYSNFYLGTILLALVLVYFFTKFAGRFFAAFGLLILMLYHGGGAWHGFFWVVPSFYLFMLTLLIWALVIEENNWSSYILVFISPVFLLIHPMSLVSFGIIVTTFLFKSLLLWQLDRRQTKKLAIFVVCILISLIVYTGLRLIGVVPDLNWGIEAQQIIGIFTQRTQGVNLVKVAQQPQVSVGYQTLSPLLNFLDFDRGSWELIRNTYLWFLKKWPVLIPFTFGLVTSIWRKNVDLISLWGVSLLYTAGAIFTMVSGTGRRLMLFVWPITFMIIAYGLYEFISILSLQIMHNFRSKKDRNLKKVILAEIGLLLVIYFLVRPFAIINHSDALHGVEFSNSNHEFEWDRTCTEYILAQTSQESIVVYDGKLSKYASFTHGLLERRNIPIGEVENFPGQELFFVCWQGLSHCETNKASILSRDNTYGEPKLSLERDCGAYDIYWFSYE